MGEIRTLAPAKLIIVVLKSQYLNIMSDVLPVLKNVFGEIDYISEELPFDTFTYYYNKEMGNNINATMLSFKDFIHPSELSYIKNKTNDIEYTFSNNGKRIINLDPGYFYTAQFVLATTKPREFRSYVGDGIWMEPVYYYSKKSLHPFETTYPNYKDQKYISIFSEIRKKYIEDLKFFRGGVIEKK
jgi:hypothetical protein